MKTRRITITLHPRAHAALEQLLRRGLRSCDCLAFVDPEAP